MGKKPPKKKDDDLHIEVESWQWETPPTKGLTWKHWLIIICLLAVAILFAFGFLIVAGVVLVIALVVNLVLFIVKKIT